jgi:AsmA protein
MSEPMAKPLKIALIVVGALFALLIGGAFAATLLFDPNDHRDQIAEQVRKQTGRELELGHLELKIFPWLAVGAESVKLGNAEGFGPEPFAEIGAARVGVKLLPLLFQREVQIGTLSVRGLRLRLAVDAEGRDNWSDLAGAKEQEPEAAPEQESAVTMDSLAIGGLDIEDGAVSYHDARSGVAYSVERLNLSTGRVRLGEPVDIELSAALTASEPAASAELEFAGKVDAQPDAQRYAVDGLRLKVRGLGRKLLQGEDAEIEATLSGGLKAELGQRIDVSGLKLVFAGGNSRLRVSGDYSGDATYDMAAQALSLPALQLNAEINGRQLLQGKDAKLNAALAGRLSAQPGKRVDFGGLRVNVTGGSSELSLQGSYAGDVAFDLVSQVLSLPAIQLNGAASGAALPGGKQELKFGGALVYDLKQGALTLDKAHIAAAGIDIRTSLKGSGLAGDAPRISGPIEIAQFSPRELLARLAPPPPATTDPAALKQASLTAQYQGTFKSATLSDVVLKLDQTTARGRIEVRDFATQAIQFALKVDQLDIDRYLPPESAEAAPAKKEAPAGSVNQIELPATALDGLNAQGTLDVGLLKVKGLKINNAQVKLAGGKGEVKKQEISAKLYGGTIALNHQFTPGKQPKYALNTSLNALNAAPFVQDFIGKDLVSGLGSLSLNLSGAGLTVGDLRRALGGDLGLKLESGAVKGFNLGQIIRKAQATLAGQAAPAESEPQKTDFSTLSFSAKIVDGILKSDSLNAASPLFRLAGSGEINLINETINFLAKPTIVESSKGEGGKGLDELKGLTIPIKLTGSLFAPSYKLDLESALKQKAFEKINQKLDSKKEELKVLEDEKKDELKQKLNDKLNKLFAPKPKPAPQQAPQQPAPAQESAPAAKAPQQPASEPPSSR